MTHESIIDFTNDEMLQFFLENSEDIMVILNEEMEAVFLSPSFEKVFQKPISENLGKKFNEVLINFPSLPLMKPNQKMVIPVVLKEPKKSLMLEFQFKPIQVKDRPGRFIFAIGRDVTERELVLKKFKDIAFKEKELNQMKSRFVSMASHEFKTPIATIVSSVMIMQMLLDKDFSDEIKVKLLGHIDKIINQSNRLTSIMSDVLLLEKSIQQDMKLNLKKISIGKFLESLIHDINEENLNRRTVRFFQPQTDKQILTDESMLVHIIRNLIQNALNYSPESSDPEVHLSIIGNFVEIRIKDYGIGIPREEHENIFGSFYRAKNVGNIKGTGLGLNIVQELTKKLKGEIWFKSKEGMGSEFFVSFPVK
ncbi:MAG: ATP-binding protein [Algoriphagus aquaeductus]|uniref:sensor histidine kinase n=1 Tax=Algoriphagus TaxID=246875 RepID=UPI00258587FD|nr:ATP-binding protein [Algoriphagus sp.]